MTSTVDAAVQTDVTDVDMFERFVKSNRSLVLEWLNESDHVAVTVYDEETTNVTGGGVDSMVIGDRRRNERTSSSSTCSSSSPPQDERTPTAATVGVDESQPSTADSREWYPTAATGSTITTISEDGGGDDDDCGSGVGSGTESIEMTNMMPTANATAATNGSKSLKFHPFV